MQNQISENLKLLFVYLKKYKKWALLGGIFMTINILLLLPTPLITMHLIDNVLPQKDFALLSYFCAVIIILLLIKGVSGFYQNLNFTKFNEKVIFDIQLDLLKTIQISGRKFRKEKGTGYLLSRLKDDPNYLHGLFASSGLAIIKDTLTFLVGVSIILSIHWKLALAAIAILPMFIYSIQKFTKRLRSISAEFLEASAIVTNKMNESVSVIDTLRIFNSFKYDLSRLVSLQKLKIRISINRAVIQSIFFNITAFISGIGPIVVIWYGMYEIMNDRLLLGELIAFNAFVGYLFGPTSRLMQMNAEIQKSLAALERIMSILAMNHSEKKGVKIIKNITGRIEFSNFSFFYGENKIIDNVNLIIEPLQKVGVVGKSGAGKSTLFNLLYLPGDIYTGNVFIDNVEISDLDINNLVRQVAILDQEPVLFHDTIFNNIRIGNFLTDKYKIYEAAEKAGIYDFIMSLPDGFNSIVGERGNNLSVGQKQRIALARAIIKDPKLLILDEPTSNLDPSTENNIYNSLESFFAERTSIIIAHKLNTIKECHKIIVLDEGKIIETGTHEELINNKNGYYRELWNNQNKFTEVVV